MNEYLREDFIKTQMKFLKIRRTWIHSHLINRNKLIEFYIGIEISKYAEILRILSRYVYIYI